MLDKNGIVSLNELINARNTISHAVEVELAEYEENTREGRIGYNNGYLDGYEAGLTKSRDLVLSLLDDLIDL